MGAIERREQAQAAGRDGDPDAPPVLRTALAADEGLALQTVEQAGDAGGLLDHAVGDVEGGQALAPRPAQDAQHVVLLEGEAVGLHDLGQVAAQPVGGEEQAHHSLVAARAERPPLLDLLPQGAHPPDLRRCNLRING